MHSSNFNSAFNLSCSLRYFLYNAMDKHQVAHVYQYWSNCTKLRSYQCLNENYHKCENSRKNIEFRSMLCDIILELIERKVGKHGNIGGVCGQTLIDCDEMKENWKHRFSVWQS